MVTINDIVRESTTLNPNVPGYDYVIVANQPIGVRMPDNNYGRIFHDVVRQVGLSSLDMDDQSYDERTVAARLRVDQDYAIRLAVLGRHIHAWDIEGLRFGDNSISNKNLRICSTSPLK